MGKIALSAVGKLWSTQKEKLYGHNSQFEHVTAINIRRDRSAMEK